MLNKLSYHIPEKIKDNNSNVSSFLNVLQAMHDVVTGEIYTYEKSFSITTAGLSQTRLFVDDFGGDYLESTTKKALECLYFNKKDGYSSKGTQYALELILNCYLQELGCGIANIEYIKGYPLIHFGTLDGGVLPNGQDFADEFGGTFDPVKYIPTLLDDSWVGSYNNINVTLTCYIPASPLLELIKLIIFLYSPFVRNVEVISITTLNLLEVGGTNAVLIGATSVMVGGEDDVLGSAGTVQNPN